MRKMPAELLHGLGGVPVERVRPSPFPGTATEADAVRVNERECGCELVNGTLVETRTGLPEAYLAGLVAFRLFAFVHPGRLGMVLTGRARFRLPSGNLRGPAASFTAWGRWSRPLPQVGNWCPDLCVEVLNPGNTKAEMAMKRADYFPAGCQLMGEIDPRTRTAAVYTAPDAVTHLPADGTLDGGAVLPGFALPLPDLFAPLDDLNQTAG